MIESSFAKLRLYKIPEFTVGSFLLAVLAVITFILQRDYGETRLTVFGGIATVVAVIVLLLELMLLRSQDVWEQLRLYGLGSAAIAVVAFAAAPRVGGGDLYAIGAITIAFKALIVPLAVGAIIRNLDVPTARAVGGARARARSCSASSSRASRSSPSRGCGSAATASLPLPALGDRGRRDRWSPSC